MIHETPSVHTPLNTQDRGLIAPASHTVFVVLLFVGLAVTGAMNRGSSSLTAPSASHGPLYISLIAAEIGLIYLIRWGLRKGKTPVSTIVGPMDRSLAAWVRDTAIAALLWGVWIGIQILASRFTHSSPTISGLLPHGPIDSILWIAVSVAAGIAEEFAFRGYLLRQFQAMTGSAPIALILQALVFSIAHGYEGLVACAGIAVFGILFGIVAQKAGNLRACMMGHAWADIAAGLL
ncbi:MAG: type II CAAX endopeptidase family protein [Gemmatimonadaceae bacterium]